MSGAAGIVSPMRPGLDGRLGIGLDAAGERVFFPAHDVRLWPGCISSRDDRARHRGAGGRNALLLNAEKIIPCAVGLL